MTSTGLKSRISYRIYITRDLLTKSLTSPIQIQNLPQELAYEGYIERSRELIQEASIYILDIEANHRKGILSTELENFKTSLHNIKHETFAVYNDLCTWKTSYVRPPAGANEECAATLEAKYTTIAQSPEPEQDGDTKGDETVET